MHRIHCYKCSNLNSVQNLYYVVYNTIHIIDILTDFKILEFQVILTDFIPEYHALM